MRDHGISVVLLLLVGFLRRPDPVNEGEDQPVCPCHQLLGRGDFRANFLDHVVSVRCGEATAHDGPDGRRTGRRAAQVPMVEGCCSGSLSGTRVERILARVCAMLLTSIPGECYGFGCI